MSMLNQKSYKTSPYWRWWNYTILRLHHQFLPKREYNDTLKTFTSLS